MAKKKDSKKAEEVEEIEIEIEEEVEAEDGASWSEEFKMAGDEIVGFIKNVIHEANVRRVMVKNSEGKVLLDIPVALGSFGLLPAVLPYSLLALGVAIFSNCSVTVERVEKTAEETE